MLREALHRHLLIPLVFRVQGSSRGAFYRELLRTQWYPKEKISKLSLTRLNGILRHASENVPYYSKMFKKINFDGHTNSMHDFAAIPILTRDIIQNCASSLTANDSETYKMKENSTGGSTGEPIHFYITKVSHDYSSADIMRHYNWAGLELGEKHAFLWGAERDSPMNSRKGKLHARALRYIWMNSFRISDSMMYEYVKLMRNYEPKILIGYASNLYALAKFLERENLDAPVLKGIQSSAEKLFSWQRKTIL